MIFTSTTSLSGDSEMEKEARNKDDDIKIPRHICLGIFISSLLNENEYFDLTQLYFFHLSFLLFSFCFRPYSFAFFMISLESSLNNIWKSF